MPSSAPDTSRARGALAQRLQRQGSWCDDLGSPLYASLLRSAAGDLDSEGADGRRRIAAAIESAAARATRDGPFAYLRMEPGAQTFEVRLTMWPGGRDELLALTRAHGTGVRWLLGIPPDLLS